jgi:hypothetical protein
MILQILGTKCICHPLSFVFVFVYAFGDRDFMLVIESFTNESHRGLVFLLRGDSLAKTPIDSGALTKLERREIIVDVIRKVKSKHHSLGIQPSLSLN